MADEPMENIKHRIFVQCNKLELNLQIEPIFASMALYDAKEKKKVSENFYFDMNSESLKSMLASHPEHKNAEYTTQARSCVFDIAAPSNDLFLVVKLEKVLQGDINEAAEPYLKEVSNLDKVRQNAYDACNRLGKYKMPFAWTAIWLQNIIKGGKELGDSGGSDAESTASNSLDRKGSISNFEQTRRGGSKADTISSSSSMMRKGSLERRDKRQSWAATSTASLASTATLIAANEAVGNSDVGNLLDTFPPVTLTVSSFFKQEGDKLRDEDLYKFLQDLKRPSPVLKRLKCIRGSLKLDISVAPEPLKHCLTPELSKLIPFPDLKSRPTKEILEFYSKEPLIANYQFRNLLYVCPKDLNFTNRQGERARNIAVKVQFMDGLKGLKVLYGKSSCPEMTDEVCSPVTYHNKSPDFYEEVKVKLPSNLREQHHLLFTFYHISCQGQRKDQQSTDLIVGYTWIPIIKEGSSLQAGVFELPVTVEPPTKELTKASTEQAGSSTKHWVDNKKNIFTVELLPATTVHALDAYIDRFLNLTAKLQLGGNTAAGQNPGGGTQGVQSTFYNMERDMEDNLLSRIRELHRAKLEPLVKFLPLILDKLLLLMVKPPAFDGHILNVGPAAFNAIAMIVNKLTSSVSQSRFP